MASTKEFFKISIIITICLSLQISKVSSAISARIVGGTTTTVSGVPYIVQLLDGGRFFCGGSLVSSTHVVTAAHCVKGMKPSQLTVVAGASKLSETGVRSKVSKIMVPKAFNTRSMRMDVAVLKLSTEITGDNIKPIALSNQSLNAGNSLKVSGWGLTNQNAKTVPNQLRTVTVRAIKKSKCTRDFRQVSTITDSMFCASIPGRKDACMGDSGGPAVCKGQLCGIVSWGIGCARRAYPGVYTSVRKVRQFIESAMKQ